MLSSGQVSVGTSAVEISGHAVGPCRVTIYNHEHGSGKRIWVGGSGVTTSNGMLINGEPFTFVLSPMEHLHAVTDTGTALLGYVKQA